MWLMAQSSSARHTDTTSIVNTPVLERVSVNSHQNSHDAHKNAKWLLVFCVFLMALQTTDRLVILDIVLKSNSLQTCAAVLAVLWIHWQNSHETVFAMIVFVLMKIAVIKIPLSKDDFSLSSTAGFWSIVMTPQLRLLHSEHNPSKYSLFSFHCHHICIFLNNNIYMKYISLITCSSVQINILNTKLLYFLKDQLCLQLPLIYTNHFFFCFVKLFHFKTTFLWLLILQCDCIKTITHPYVCRRKNIYNQVIHSSLSSCWNEQSTE